MPGNLLADLQEKADNSGKVFSFHDRGVLRHRRPALQQEKLIWSLTVRRQDATEKHGR
jgi:hypothetical protein